MNSAKCVLSLCKLPTARTTLTFLVIEDPQWSKVAETMQNKAILMTRSDIWAESMLPAYIFSDLDCSVSTNLRRRRTYAEHTTYHMM